MDRKNHWRVPSSQAHKTKPHQFARELLESTSGGELLLSLVGRGNQALQSVPARSPDAHVFASYLGAIQSNATWVTSQLKSDSLFEEHRAAEMIEAMEDVCTLLEHIEYTLAERCRSEASTIEYEVDVEADTLEIC